MCVGGRRTCDARRSATPSAQPQAATTKVSRAPDSGAGGATSRGTLLSLVAGLHYPSGKYFPPAGTTFYVLKESLDAALIRSGLQPLPGVSPLRAWIMACEAKQDATIRPI
ncbi:MAG TPA: hypothetical protein VGL25_01460 [Casimicrobiaceae bacterium]